MSRHSIIYPCLLLLLVLACNQPKEKETDPQLISQEVGVRIDSTLKAFVDAGDIAGVSALIYEKGEEVYYNAFGYADLNGKKPMERNTIVQIFSMTKPVTGTALMTLYDEGAFQLDDPLSKYLPEYDNAKVFVGMDENGNPVVEDAKRPITIRDLTRHTAGFATNGNIPGLGKLLAEADAGNRNNTLSQMSEKLASVPLWFHPGEKWEYGPSVDVQARLVEKLAGKPYHDYVREKVLAPLGLTETRYVVPEEDMARLSDGYSRSQDGVLTQLPTDQTHAFNSKKWPLTPGGYGLTSTLDDYMKFAQMLVHNGSLNGVTILKPETVKLMATSHLADSVEERSWLPSKGQVGFGIDFAVRLRPPASPEENNGVVGEFFWDGAASTLFWVDPVNELTAVLFVQLFPFDQIGLHKAFRDAVYGPISQ